jgi:hypothetical protein
MGAIASTLVLVELVSIGPLFIGAAHSQNIWLVVGVVVVVVLFLAIMGSWKQRPDGTKWPMQGRYWHIGPLKPPDSRPRTPLTTTTPQATTATRQWPQSRLMSSPGTGP